MTTNPDPPDQRLIQLARKIDDHIGSTDRCLDYDSILDPQVSESLDADDREQLDRIAGTLAWLDQIRGRIHQRSQEHIPDETIASTDSMLVTPVGETGNRQVHSGDAASTPAQIGRFQIVRLLGQGGFARVFLARDPRLDRLVALKVPNPHSLMSPESQARFEREARAASILDHPNIVSIFETGSIGPVHYIASAWCAGQSLDIWFQHQQRNVSPRTAAEIVACLADAVDHAHRRGVVHRDLKPGNILIAADTQTDDNSPPASPEISSHIQIADFGLAKYETVDQFETAEGAIVGTPAYMSPEQTRGDQHVSEASDIWSLGVILYELLTGQLPFRGSNHISTLQAIATTDPKPPAKQQPAKNIPVDLDAICLKCLEKEPESRYSHAGALRQDLQNWLDGLPVQASRPSRSKRIKLWCLRNPALAGALLFAVICLTAGLGVASWNWLDAAAERNRSRQSIGTAQDTIDHLVNDLIFDPNVPDHQRDEYVRQSIELQQKLLASAPDDTRVLIASIRVWRQLISYYFECNQFGKALEAVAHSRELVQRLPPDHELRREFGKMLEVDETKIAAMTHPESVTPPGPLREEPQTGHEWLMRSQQHHQAGLALFRQQKYDVAMQEYEKGMQCLAQLPADNMFTRDMRGRLFIEQATIHFELTEFDRTELAIREALEEFLPISEAMGSHSELDENLARCFLTLGKIHMKRNQWPKAIVELGKARKWYAWLYQSSPRTVRLAKQILLTSKCLAISFENDRQYENLVEELQSWLKIYSNLKPEVEESLDARIDQIENSLWLAETCHDQARAELCQTTLRDAAPLIRSLPDLGNGESAEFKRRFSQLRMHYPEVVDELE